MHPKISTNETVPNDDEIEELSIFLGLSEYETKTTINNLTNS